MCGSGGRPSQRGMAAGGKVLRAKLNQADVGYGQPVDPGEDGGVSDDTGVDDGIEKRARGDDGGHAYLAAANFRGAW